MAYYLGQHPKIFVPAIKEPTYFGSDLTRFGGITEKAYQELYSGWGQERFALDGSTACFVSKMAASEIAEKSPTARIIIMVRNPVDAIYSQYFQNVADGLEQSQSFEAALDAESRRAAAGVPPKHGSLERLLYFRIFSFSDNISRFGKHFTKENIHTVIFDDFSSDTGRSVSEILNWLELNLVDFISYDTKNASKRVLSRNLSHFTNFPPRWARALTKCWLPRDMRIKMRAALSRLNQIPAKNPRMRPETRRMLNGRFEPEVRALSRMLGRDLSHWLQSDD